MFYIPKAVIVVQLGDQLLPIPEVQGSNSVISKILLGTIVLLTVEKKETRKRPNIDHF